MSEPTKLPSLATLDALEAIEKAATEGPWETRPASGGGLVLLRGGPDYTRSRHLQTHVQIVPEEDADFIAEARTVVPALIGAARWALLARAWMENLANAHPKECAGCDPQLETLLLAAVVLE